jgi:integrase
MANPAKLIEHEGKSLTLKQWAEHTGLKVETIRSRIEHQGWPVARALGTPAGGRPAPAPRAVAKPCPPLKLHKPSGRAFVRWKSPGAPEQFKYLGPWGSNEAADAYRRFQHEWAADGPAAADGSGVGVGELVARYLVHAAAYYVKDGRPTSEQYGQRAALRFLNNLYGDTPAAEFRPAHLRACVEGMKAADLTRTTINQYQWRIVNCFAWAVGQDLIPPEVHQRLTYVENLRPGRSDAREKPPVRSVPPAVVEATIPHLDDDPARRAVLAAMVRLQLASGLRPGELCAMTAGAIDTSGAEWLYEIDGHKNLHRQVRRKPKRVWLGPKAQAILRPFLDAAPPGGRVWVFPGSPPRPVRRVRFWEAVRRACVRAGVEPWHPHQLRHNKATAVQDVYESDAHTAAAIGDTPEVARAVYVDPRDAVARRVARELG